jgi:hypothetical protein
LVLTFVLTLVLVLVKSKLWFDQTSISLKLLRDKMVSREVN